MNQFFSQNTAYCSGPISAAGDVRLSFGDLSVHWTSLQDQTVQATNFKDDTNGNSIKNGAPPIT